MQLSYLVLTSKVYKKLKPKKFNRGHSIRINSLRQNFSKIQMKDTSKITQKMKEYKKDGELVNDLARI